MTDELAQPDVEDSRWTIDEQRHFVGMDCTVERDGDEVAGEIAAIWLFPGRARACRGPAGRRSVQRREGTGEFREVVTGDAMNLYNPSLGTVVSSKIGTAQNTTTEEPRPIRASTSQVFARVGLPHRFFCRRHNKSLASSSGHALRRGVLGRRVGHDTTSMRYAQENLPQEPRRLELQRNERGTTGETDEEERGEKSVSLTTSQSPISRNPQTGSRYRNSELDAVRLGAFITTTNWNHSVTIPSPFPTGSGEGGTSVVPLLSSGGVAA